MLGKNSKQEYLVIFNTKSISKKQAALSIGTTFIVCLILGFGSLILSKITLDLVITPIETMMDKVKRISENPLKAAAEEENE